MTMDMNKSIVASMALAAVAGAIDVVSKKNRAVLTKQKAREYDYTSEAVDIMMDDLLPEFNENLKRLSRRTTAIEKVWMTGTHDEIYSRLQGLEKAQKEMETKINDVTLQTNDLTNSANHLSDLTDKLLAEFEKIETSSSEDAIPHEDGTKEADKI